MSAIIIFALFYQCKPAYGNKYGKYPSRTWKTTCGHLWNCHRLSYCILANEILRGTPYRLAGTVNFLHDLTVAEHAYWWPIICTALRRKGVEAFWIREVSKKTNRVHYHLIIASDHTEETLKAIINKACPCFNLKMQFDPLKKSAWWTNYILKIKISGTDRKSGLYNDDFYEYKRVLFHEDCELRKCHKIGDFWKKNQDDIWDDHVKDIEAQRIRENRPDRQQMADLVNDTDVIRAANKLANITGEDIDVVLKRLAIQIHQDPTVRDTLQGDDVDFAPKTPPVFQPMTPPVNGPTMTNKEAAQAFSEWDMVQGLPEPPKKPRKKPTYKTAKKLTQRPVIVAKTKKTKTTKNTKPAPFNPADLKSFTL